MSGYTNNVPGTPTFLTVTTAVNFAKGVPGTVGAANDTILNGIKIASNATAVTVTVTGFRDQTGAAASIVFTGSTTADTWVPLGWLNTQGPLTVTASVASKVVVETVAF
jgi:hypothetical protein